MLTVDFCGGCGGKGYGQTLVTALRDRRASRRPSSSVPDGSLPPRRRPPTCADPLFELANHGTAHRPLSSTGKAADGIPGIRTAGEVYDEIMTDDTTLTLLAGAKPPSSSGPGTAYLDEVAARIVGGLGLTPASFSVNGDSGATYPAATPVARGTGKARPGDIILCHGSQPASGTSEGIARALDSLAASGARFVPLPYTARPGKHCAPAPGTAHSPAARLFQLIENLPPPLPLAVMKTWLNETCGVPSFKPAKEGLPDVSLTGSLFSKCGW